MMTANLKFRDGRFPKTVQSDIKDSTKPGSRKVQERTGLHPEEAGKPRGFGQRNVCARTPLNQLRDFVSNVIMCCPVNVDFVLYM